MKLDNTVIRGTGYCNILLNMHCKHFPYFQKELFCNWSICLLILVSTYYFLFNKEIEAWNWCGFYVRNVWIMLLCQCLSLMSEIWNDAIIVSSKLFIGPHLICMRRGDGKTVFLFLPDNWLLGTIILLPEVSRVIAFILTSIKVKC